MPATGSDSREHVLWARRVNQRWIVHHGLKESANNYLNHLEQTDAQRLMRSSQHARALVQACPAGDDPKPWFYAGLFSLVTAAEAGQFLKDHWFTAACIPTLPEEFGAGSTPEGVGAETRTKLRCIQTAVAELADGTVVAGRAPSCRS